MIAFLLKVWGLVQPYRGRLFLGVAAGFLAGLIEPLMIATITSVYSLVFPSANAPELSERLKWAPPFVQDWAKSAQEALATGFQSHPIAAIALVGAIPIVILLRGFFTYLNIYFLQWAAIRAITDLRVRLFSHLLNLSASFFSRASSGELISRTLSDTYALHGIISNATAIIVKDPVTLAALLAGLLWQQPRLTLISMVVLPLCLVPIVIYGRKVRRSTSALHLQGAKLSEVMSEAFTGNRIIKAYNLEGPVIEQFRETAGKLVGHYMRIVRSSETPGPLLEFCGAIGVGLVFLFLMSQTGARPGSAGFLTVILSIFAMYRPLKNLARLQNNLQQARAASQRAFELLDAVSAVVEPPSPRPLKAAGADIRFDHLDFAYGEKLSTVVQATVPVLCDTLQSLIKQYARGERSMSECGTTRS